MSNVKKLLVLILTIFILLGVTGCIDGYIFDDSDKNKEKMLKYIEDKYNQKFTVFSYIESGALINTTDERNELILYIDENPNNSFHVYEYINDKGNYKEDYKLAYFTKELNDNLDLNKFNGPALGKIHVNTTTSGGTKMADNYNSLTEFISNDQNAYMELFIVVQGNYSEQYVDEINNFYNLVKSCGATSYTLSIGFVEDVNKLKNSVYKNQYGITWWDNIQTTKVYGYVFMSEEKSKVIYTKL